MQAENCGSRSETAMQNSAPVWILQSDHWDAHNVQDIYDNSKNKGQGPDQTENQANFENQNLNEEGPIPNWLSVWSHQHISEWQQK